MMAYICTHDGHTLHRPEGVFCPLHGTPIFTDCACGKPWTVTGYGYGGSSAGADFCVHCAHPGPWVSRTKRIAWIKGRLHQQGLDEAIELELREALDRLTDLGAADTRTIAAWQKLKEVAPKLWEIAKPVVTTVVAEDVKRRLGL